MRLVAVPLAVAFVSLSGCDILEAILAPPCDPASDPDCVDETKGNITGTVTIPGAGAAAAIPRTLSPDLRAMRSALAAAASKGKGAPASMPTKKRRVPRQASFEDSAPKVRVEEFRAGE